MNPITILFAWISKYVPMFEDYATTYEEAKLWWKGICPGDRMPDGSVNKIPPFVRKIKKFCDMWYGKVAGAIIFVWGTNWLAGFMNPDRDDDSEDDRD